MDENNTVDTGLRLYTLDRTFRNNQPVWTLVSVKVRKANEADLPAYARGRGDIERYFITLEDSHSLGRVGSRYVEDEYISTDPMKLIKSNRMAYISQINENMRQISNYRKDLLALDEFSKSEEIQNAIRGS